MKIGIQKLGGRVNSIVVIISVNWIPAFAGMVKREDVAVKDDA